MLQNQFVDLAILQILERDPDLQFAAEFFDPHIHHELRNTMDLASVLATLGIVDENQVSTAGTISIMKSASQYCNLNGVRVSYYLCNQLKLIFT